MPRVSSRPPRRVEPTTLVEQPVRSAEQPTPDTGPRLSSGERRTVTIACCALVQLDRPSGEVGTLDLEVLSEAAIAFERPIPIFGLFDIVDAASLLEHDFSSLDARRKIRR